MFLNIIYPTIITNITIISTPITPTTTTTPTISTTTTSTSTSTASTSTFITITINYIFNIFTITLTSTLGCGKRFYLQLNSSFPCGKIIGVRRWFLPLAWI